MTEKESESCIGTIEMLRRLAYNIHGVMDVIDADNCEKIIKVLSDIPKYKDAYGKGWNDGAKASYEHLKMCEEEQGGDLISRDAVLDIIHLFFTEEVDKIPTKKTEDGEVYVIHKCQPLFEMNKAICKRIKALPSVTAEPTGHWITGRSTYYDVEMYRCSECKNWFPYKVEKCPNCHVKMVEPQESDHKCHTCKHYTSGEHDGSCGSYICKGYSNWESEE